MTDPNELTRFDRMTLEAGWTCLYLETRRGFASAAWFISAEQSFKIIESARLQEAAETHLSTSVFDRWMALREGKL